MPDITTIRAALLSANIAAVSRATGLASWGLRKIRDGKSDPKHSTLEKLAAHFEGVKE